MIPVFHSLGRLFPEPLRLTLFLILNGSHVRGTMLRFVGVEEEFLTSSLAEPGCQCGKEEQYQPKKRAELAFKSLMNISSLHSPEISNRVSPVLSFLMVPPMAL